MSQKKIEDIDGRMAAIYGVSEDEASLIVRLENNKSLLVPIHLLKNKNEESYILPHSFQSMKSFDDPTLTLPVIEENPVIKKRKVETEQVTIKKHINEQPKVVEETLSKEEIIVERVAMNELRDEPLQPRTEGDTTIIPVQEEILVVQKKYLVREEVRIKKVKTQHNEKVTVNLKKEEVTVDRKKLN